MTALRTAVMNRIKKVQSSWLSGKFSILLKENFVKLSFETVETVAVSKLYLNGKKSITNKKTYFLQVLTPGVGILFLHQVPASYSWLTLLLKSHTSSVTVHDLYFYFYFNKLEHYLTIRILISQIFHLSSLF